MIKRLVNAVGMLLLIPVSLAAQEVVDLETQVAAFMVVAEHASDVATRGIGSEVTAQEMTVASPSGPQTAVGIVASRLEARVGFLEQVVRCDDIWDCRSTDGSRAGFRIDSAEFNDFSATIVVDVWYLVDLVDSSGRRRLTGRADRLYLVRSGSGWRIDHVEPVAQR